jgi:hypothetical protein
MNNYRGNQDTLAKLFDVSQRLQVWEGLFGTCLAKELFSTRMPKPHLVSTAPAQHPSTANTRVHEPQPRQRRQRQRGPVTRARHGGCVCAQVSPEFSAELYDLTTSLMDVFVYIRDNQVAAARTPAQFACGWVTPALGPWGVS